MIQLYTERLFIREMEKRDAEFIVQLRNNPEVHRWFFRPNKITMEEHLEWFRRTRDRRFDLIIELKESGDRVGTFNFKWNDNHEALETGRIIHPENTRQGIATEAALASFDYFLKDRRYEKIISFTRQENEPNLALLRKLGFDLSDPFSMERQGNETEVVKSSISREKFNRLHMGSA